MITIALSAAALGHEGHEALPSKGVTVRGDTVLLSPEARTAIGLTTVEVVQADLERTLTANGTIEIPWYQHAFVAARVGGRLSSLKYQSGEAVSTGDLLAEIESPELLDTQFELIQYQLELELAEKTVERVASLSASGTVAQKELTAASATLSEKSAAVETTRHKLLAVGFTAEQLDEVIRTRQPLKTLSVIANRDGTLIHSDINPGQIVEATTHLFEIVDFSKVFLKATVVEAEAYRVVEGQTTRVKLAAAPQSVLSGQIKYVGLQVDPKTRAIPVWIEIENLTSSQPLARPGMFATVEIVTDQVQATVVPTSAMVLSGASSWLFVEQQAGAYLRTNVITGLVKNGQTQIKDGVVPGDKVVVNGSRQLASFFVQGTFDLPVETQRNIGLTLQPVAKHPIDTTVIINGAIEIPPQSRAFASSQIVGRVAKIAVDQNQEVQRNQVIAEVESLEFQDLQLKLLANSDQLRLAKSLVDASRATSRIIAGQQSLQRETDYQKLKNEQTVLEAKLRSLGISQTAIDKLIETREPRSTLAIRSPIDGWIVTVLVIPGQVIKPGEALVEIHDLSRVWVRAHVFEQQVGSIQLGNAARVRIASDPMFVATAKLLRTNNIVDGANRVLAVWAELENPQQTLKNNMRAQLSVVKATAQPKTALPLSAIYREGENDYVFVQVPWKTNRFERRPVKLGTRDDQFVEVRSGVDEGDSIAVSGVQQLQTAFASIR